MAVFLYCCPDCLSCLANAIQVGRATSAVWAAMKKYSLWYVDIEQKTAAIEGRVLVLVSPVDWREIFMKQSVGKCK